MTDSTPTPPPSPPSRSGDRLPPWRLVAAIALPLIAIVVVVMLAGRIGSEPATDATAALALGEVEAPGAASPACAQLMVDLPTVLGGLDRRQLVGSPSSAATGAVSDGTQDGGTSDLQAGAVAAWGDPPVVLRCGIPTPAELTCSAPVQVVDGVTWLPLTGQGATSYVVVDRSVRVALTVPDSVTSTGPWQEMSKIVARALPARAICAGGVPIPADGE